MMDEINYIINSINQLTPSDMRQNANYKFRVALIKEIEGLYGTELAEGCIMSMKIELPADFHEKNIEQFDELVQAYRRLAVNLFNTFKEDFVFYEEALYQAFKEFSLSFE